jgi:hypothetical protein
MVSRPRLVSPLNISIQDFARRIASETMPILQDVQGCALLGSLASAATVTSALGAGTLVKDLGGLGAIYDAAGANERVGGELRALAGAAAHAKVSGQIGFDLVRARVALSQAEEAARTLKSPVAESALVFRRPELQRLQNAFESERACDWLLPRGHRASARVVAAARNLAPQATPGAPKRLCLFPRARGVGVGAGQREAGRPRRQACSAPLPRAASDYHCQSKFGALCSCQNRGFLHILDSNA